MATVTIEDLNEEQKKVQTRKESGPIKKAIIESQAYSSTGLILLVAFISQYLGVDLAHLLGAWLLFKGIPPVTVNFKAR